MNTLTKGTFRPISNASSDCTGAQLHLPLELVIDINIRTFVYLSIKKKLYIWVIESKEKKLLASSRVYPLPADTMGFLSFLFWQQIIKLEGEVPFFNCTIIGCCIVFQILVTCLYMISMIYIGQKVSFWVKASDFTMEKKIVLDLNRTPLQSDDEQDEDLVLRFLCFGFFFFFFIRWVWDVLFSFSIFKDVLWAFDLFLSIRLLMS